MNIAIGFRHCGQPLVVFSCPGLALGFLSRCALLFLAGLTCRERNGLPLCKVIAQCNPLAIVGNLVKESEFIRGEFRFNDRRCVWPFLFAAPAKQERRGAVIGQAHLRCERVAAHSFVAARNSGGSAFAKECASALTAALARYSARETGRANSGESGIAELETRVGCLRITSYPHISEGGGFSATISFPSRATKPT